MDTQQGKQRLVTASQALELQHLQAMIRARDKERSHSEMSFKAEAEQLRDYSERLAQRNAQLEQNVKLVGERLRVLEDENSRLASLAQRADGHGLDTPHECTETIRQLRNQISSLLEEREVLLEKLVNERGKAATLEAKLDGATLVSKKREAMMLNDVAVQTGDILGGSLHQLQQTVETMFCERGQQQQAVTTLDTAKATATLAEAIETIRLHISVEQSSLQYHEEQCRLYTTNIGVLRDALQRNVQRQVMLLQEEQAKYSSMIAEVPSSRPVAYGAAATPNRKAHDTFNASNVKSQVDEPWTAQQGSNIIRSPAPTALGRSSQPSASKPHSSVFFMQQEAEMMNLRKRLQDLQSRHQQTTQSEGVGALKEDVASKPRPLGSPSFAQSLALRFVDERNPPSTPPASQGVGVVQQSSILQRMLANASKTNRGDFGSGY